jgi:alpha-beta hydrolase superfamily lysophospholipase
MSRALPQVYFFDDELFEQFCRELATVGRCPLGEVAAVVARIPNGDRDAWYREWMAAGDRLAAAADAARSGSHEVSAGELYLRASCYYRTAYKPLFGFPVDPRLVAAFDAEERSCLAGAALAAPVGRAVEIPFEGTTLPGLYVSADEASQPHQTLIATDGYDSTIYQMYVDLSPALRRGYNLLLFDGPGQGRALIKQSLVMRPDWENVVRPVVDFALTLPGVDPRRIALIGWSFGGYLAPRAASTEHRLAAAVADPGLWSMLESWRDSLPLSDAVKRQLPNVPPDILESIAAEAIASPIGRWKILQRGLWVHGVQTVADYLKLSPEYSMVGIAERIRCPTLLTQAESDPLAANAGIFFDALTCERVLLKFTDDEGAGEHCEGGNRPLLHERVFDWLDDVLG